MFIVIVIAIAVAITHIVLNSVLKTLGKEETTENQLVENHYSVDIPIVDEDGIKVTFKKYLYGSGYENFYVLIENNTENNLLFTIKNFSVNSYSMNGELSNFIGAKKKSNCIIAVPSSDFYNNDITVKDIQNINFDLNADYEDSSNYTMLKDLNITF